jgi:acyl carrier protein
MPPDEQIRQRVAEIVSVVLASEPPTDSIAPDPALEWDSLRRIEIILAVEEEFDLIVPEEDFAALHSVETISTYVTDLRAPD